MLSMILNDLSLKSPKKKQPRTVRNEVTASSALGAFLRGDISREMLKKIEEELGCKPEDPATTPDNAPKYSVLLTRSLRIGVVGSDTADAFDTKSPVKEFFEDEAGSFAYLSSLAFGCILGVRHPPSSTCVCVVMASQAPVRFGNVGRAFTLRLLLRAVLVPAPAQCPIPVRVSKPCDFLFVYWIHSYILNRAEDPDDFLDEPGMPMPFVWCGGDMPMLTPTNAGLKNIRCVLKSAGPPEGGCWGITLCATVQAFPNFIRPDNVTPEQAEAQVTGVLPNDRTNDRYELAWISRFPQMSHPRLSSRPACGRWQQMVEPFQCP